MEPHRVLLCVFATSLFVVLCQSQSVSYYQQLVPLPSGLRNQDGYTYLRVSTMMNLFGAPCSLTPNCRGVTNPNLRNQIQTRQIGKFAFTGMSRALDALARALNKVRVEKPALYAALGSSGMLCCRAIRGSSSSFSNHAWGSAVDFNVGGQLDPRADGKAQRALLELYPYMHEQGFFWAGGYSAGSEDSMHFEIANEVMLAWGNNPSQGDYGSCTSSTGATGECIDYITCSGQTEQFRCPGPSQIRCCFNAAKTYKCVTVSSTLSVRNGPCTTYQRITSVTDGTPLEVLDATPIAGCGYNWIKIKRGSFIGYVADQYVEDCTPASIQSEDLGIVINDTDVLPPPGHEAINIEAMEESSAPVLSTIFSTVLVAILALF